MMLPIRPPKQPTARPCARASHADQSHALVGGGRFQRQIRGGAPL